MNVIHVNSETLGLLLTANQPISIPLCEPEFHSHSQPHTHHNTIYFIIYEINIQNSPNTVTDYTNGLQKLQQFGSKIWDRSNGRSRPQTNRNINKALKSRVTSSRMKLLPHGVCRNSLKPEPTRRSHCVERLSFLSRRIQTIGSPVILDISRTLSLSLKHNLKAHCISPLSLHVLFFYLKVGDNTILYFVLLSFNQIQ